MAYRNTWINPLNTKLNPICHLLALLGAHHILHVSRVRVNGDNRPLSTSNMKYCVELRQVMNIDQYT